MSSVGTKETCLTDKVKDIFHFENTFEIFGSSIVNYVTTNSHVLELPTTNMLLLTAIHINYILPINIITKVKNTLF